MNFPLTIKNKIYKEAGGSIVLEAAFVMPLVVLSVFALIYLSFYLHDYSRITGAIDLIMHKAGVGIRHEADLDTGWVYYDRINERGVFYALTGDFFADEKRIEQLLIKELDGGLFISQISKAEVELGIQSINIKLSAKADISLPLINTAAGSLLVMNFEVRYPVHNPAETIRICELILDTGSKIKGMDKLKNALARFAPK